jgi:hypothetical protein
MATVSPRKARTKSGVPLDPGYEDRLVKEAEAGFDVGSLVRRPVGRPSLSGTKSGHSNRLDLRVDDDTYDAIRRIAQNSDRRISEVVRDAIRRYLEAG